MLSQAIPELLKPFFSALVNPVPSVQPSPALYGFDGFELHFEDGNR